MERGYVKLWRKTLDSRVMADETAFRLWCWCLMKAGHKRRYVFGELLEPGQFITGRDSGAAELGLKKGTWYSAMKRLESWGQIALLSSSRRTTVSVCNWETYQQDEEAPSAARQQRVNNASTTRQQPVNTNKNVNIKECKNERNKKGGFEPSAVELPEGLRTDAFTEVWLQWIDHRREKRKPLTPTAVSRQLAGLAKLGSTRAVAKVDYSIQQGYEGLYDPPANGKSKDIDLDI
jgi:hypothetical protein